MGKCEFGNWELRIEVSVQSFQAFYTSYHITHTNQYPYAPETRHFWFAGIYRHVDHKAPEQNGKDAEYNIKAVAKPAKINRVR